MPFLSFPFTQLEQVMNTKPTRYAPVLVGLHWLLAALIMLAMTMGTLVLKEMPNTSPEKVGSLRGHMIVGMVIAALMLVRLVTRLRTTLPPPVPAGHALLDPLGRAVHVGLYVAVFAMAASGAATALQAGLPAIVFGGGAAALPENFAGLLPRVVHGWMAKLIMVLVVLHVVGALFHQFGLRDRLLSRMWFGQR